MNITAPFLRCCSSRSRFGNKKPKIIFAKPLDKFDDLVYNNHAIDFREPKTESEVIKLTQKEYFELQSIYEKEGQNKVSDIAKVMSGTNYIDRTTLIATAYVLYKSNEDNSVSLDSIDSFCESIGADNDRKIFLEGQISDTWQMVAVQKTRYPSNVLKSIILFYENKEIRLGDECKTPASIARLACKLFGFKDNDEIADFGIGSAAFTVEAYLVNPFLRFHGIEIIGYIKEIAAIKLEVMGCSVNIDCANILDLDPNSHSYQYIFSNYPFGLRYREIGFKHNGLLQTVQQKAPGLTKSVSSDWFFNAAIVECLKENGKGIAVMTNGSTWNTLDRSARKYFIENGYIEAVIALPERMFESTGISTTMIVLSKNNERTMLVDATGMCEKGRRFNTFTDEQIDRVVYAVSHETTNSRYVSREELINNDYVINPTRYLIDEIVVENGVPFESIIKSITRGAQIKASELDEIVTDEPTEYQYLMLTNIQKGQIDSKLPYIKEIQDNQKKYCLKNHSLILSKNGAPFKIAIAEVKPGEMILANGNLYIIELDEDKVDPYYVKAFLESEKGIATLKSITVGASIPSIGVEALRKIQIPLIPIEEQRKVAVRYLAKVDEIALFQRKLQKAYEELGHIYDSKE